MEGGLAAGHGTERGEAERRRPEGGGAAWHGHASVDHATGHADIGIAKFLSTQGSKSKKCSRHLVSN